MNLPVRRTIIGALTAIALAFAMAVPTVRGISTWKYLLGAIGLALFLLAGRNPSPKT